ncbi:MAG: GNAT family N-acetyltransferase [Ilumatobacter sp.]
MGSSHWPLFDLEVRTPRLTLRYPDDALLVEMLDVAAAGVHDDDFMPFEVPWTRHEPPKLQQEALRFHWSCRAEACSELFRLPLAVIVDGAVVGSSEIAARGFGVSGQFGTGSWLGQGFQGRGLGTEMRLATLHLGFDGFGASAAHTSFWFDNAASEAVTRKLGYTPNGVFVSSREGHAAAQHHYTMRREHFATLRRADITLAGVDSARDFLDLRDGPNG